MSLEKNAQQAARWLEQAQRDLKTAQGSRAMGSHEWACFQSQQAAEKAVKALWYFHSFDPWGHSVLKLIQDFPDQSVASTLGKLKNQAARLDKLYIPTRYPNGLPDLVPGDAYTSAEAAQAMKAAKQVIDLVASLIQ